MVTRYAHPGPALLALLLALGLVGLTLAVGEIIPRSAVSAGGGVSTSGALQLQASIGQPVAGAVGSDLRLCSGLICGGSAPDAPVEAQPIYLPLIVR